MQKFAILTMAVAGLWILAIGLPDRTAIAWQEGEPAGETEAPQDDPQQQPAVQAADQADPLNLNPPIDPAVAAEATALLQQARDRLYAYRSVDAKLVQRASFGPRRFRCEGRYQTGTFPQLRLEYRIRVGQSEGVVVEVCDGQILLTHRYVRNVNAPPDQIDPAQYQVSRKDVRRILQASDVVGTPPEAVLQAELGIGGLPALLASIERSMEFESIQQRDHGDRTFFVLQCRWRQEFLQKLDSELATAAQQIAPFMPSRVRVYLHHETLFPERILYLQQASIDPVTYRGIMSLEFVDVKLNEGVESNTFRISPPPEGVREYDETNLFIQMIEGEREQEEAAATGTPATATTPDSSSAPQADQDN